MGPGRRFPNAIRVVSAVTQLWFGYTSLLTTALIVTFMSLVAIGKTPNRSLQYYMFGMYIVSCYYDVHSAIGTKYEAGTLEANIIRMRMFICP